MYYLLQFQPRGVGDGWKIFRVNSKIQVYYSDNKAKEDIGKYSRELKKNFRIKTVQVHPRIEHPGCMWEDVK